MELIRKLIDFVLHVDTHLGELMQQFGGGWMYAILFVIIFAETGLVVTPFLPGDSLLFAVGALCARFPNDINIVAMMGLLSIAAIFGDTVNYWVGTKLGPRIFRGEKVRFLNKKHLERTHEFYERYGGKTIIIARFVPIVRTFAPFVAGMGSMAYRRFMSFNVIGGIAWVVSFLLLGFFFGNMPVVKKNFSLVILGIIVLSIVPAVIEFLRERARAKRKV